MALQHHGMQDRLCFRTFGLSLAFHHHCGCNTSPALQVLRSCAACKFTPYAHSMMVGGLCVWKAVGALSKAKNPILVLTLRGAVVQSAPALVFAPLWSYRPGELTAGSVRAAFSSTLRSLCLTNKPLDLSQTTKLTVKMLLYLKLWK